jgi:hypothetical protein
MTNTNLCTYEEQLRSHFEVDIDVLGLTKAWDICNLSQHVTETSEKMK